MAEPAARYVCRQAGCARGYATGHALYRTSPKGVDFEGVCAQHLDGPPDPIVQAIEERNQHTDSAFLTSATAARSREKGDRS
jgi:hypothetical protein